MTTITLEYEEYLDLKKRYDFFEEELEKRNKEQKEIFNKQIEDLTKRQDLLESETIFLDYHDSYFSYYGIRKTLNDIYIVKWKKEVVKFIKNKYDSSWIKERHNNEIKQLKSIISNLEGKIKRKKKMFIFF